jgi:hypothetical protein
VLRVGGGKFKTLCRTGESATGVAKIVLGKMKVSINSSALGSGWIEASITDDGALRGQVQGSGWGNGSSLNIHLEEKDGKLVGITQEDICKANVTLTRQK